MGQHSKELIEKTTTPKMERLTGDERWGRLYRSNGEEVPEGSDKSQFRWRGYGIRDSSEYWTSASSQACLRELTELEEDPELRRRGWRLTGTERWRMSGKRWRSRSTMPIRLPSRRIGAS
ncbi:hypothetical protein PV433_03770 [Paenibacillus sp. GYB004]|uniref:hypothetical protein n=1 Tax=Paenibacillus sp. GYB004 TaxID=2994393 RepID=UPI002F96A25E